MSHHFPKSTVEASIYCPKCGKDTPWRVAGGLRQFCIPCYNREKAEPPKKPTETQGSLF